MAEQPVGRLCRARPEGRERQPRRRCEADERAARGDDVARIRRSSRGKPPDDLVADLWPREPERELEALLVQRPQAQFARLPGRPGAAPELDLALERLRGRRERPEIGAAPDGSGASGGGTGACNESAAATTASASTAESSRLTSRAVDLTSTDTAFGIFVGLGLSAAAGLRLFVPLLVASVASATGHLELAPEFDWIGTTPALVGFAVAAALEVCAYLVPFLDNALDALAAPAATVAGTVLTASTIVDVSPWLKWSLAIVAGGGIAGTIQLFTGATRLTSTATTGGVANPAVSTAEAGGAAGMSILAIATPVLGAVLAAALVFVAVRALGRRRLRLRNA